MGEAEFTVFVASTKRSVLGAVRANLRPDQRHSLDDVVQEAYLRMYRYMQKHGALDESVRLQAWAYVIARNEARRWNTKHRRLEQPPALAPADPRSQEHMDQIEGEAELAELLLAIPEPFRSPLALLGRDLSTGEIALALGIPAGTAKSRISRGRALLRKIVERRRAAGEMA